MPRFTAATALAAGAGFLDREPLDPEFTDQVLDFLVKLYAEPGVRKKQVLTYDAVSTLAHELVDRLTFGVPRPHIGVHRDNAPYLALHTLNAAVFAVEAGRLAGHGHRLFDLGMASMVHDLGMLAVPKAVLESAEPLSEENLRLVQAHPEVSLKEIEPWSLVSAFTKIAILQHHERCDGSGYPAGKTDSEIHPFAKLMGVADVLSALLLNRPYRSRLSCSEAQAALRGMAGKGLDPAAVDFVSRSLLTD